MWCCKTVLYLNCSPYSKLNYSIKEYWEQGNESIEMINFDFFLLYDEMRKSLTTHFDILRKMLLHFTKKGNKYYDFNLHLQLFYHSLL